MRRSLVVGLALAIAAHSHAARADPSTPQISPIHFQREDAQLLRDQQRALDGEPPVAPDRPPPAAGPAPPAVDTAGARRTRVAGLVLLGAAGGAALASVQFLALDTPSNSNQGTYDVVAKGLLITAAAAAITGTVLLSLGHSTVQVAPAVTPRSVALAIMGRI